MAELAEQYHAVRRRASEVIASLGPDDWARRVPACPAWDVHDLVAHLSGIPDELANGRYPSGDLQAWLDAIVTSRRTIDGAELLERWAATEGRIDPIVDGGGLLLVDVAAHEHDLAGALGRPADRATPELATVLRLTLTLLTAGIDEAGLGPLAVDTGTIRVASHEGPAACTLRVDGWEGFRALESRRTAAELSALPHDGELDGYIGVIHRHSPLPERSLGER